MEGKAGIQSSLFILHKALSDTSSLQKQFIVQFVVVSEHFRADLISFFELLVTYQLRELLVLNLESHFVLHCLDYYNIYNLNVEKVL